MRDAQLFLVVIVNTLVMITKLAEIAGPVFG